MIKRYESRASTRCRLGCFFFLFYMFNMNQFKRNEACCTAVEHCEGGGKDKVDCMRSGRERPLTVMLPLA